MRSLSPIWTSRRRRNVPTLHECVHRNDITGVKSCLANDVMSWNTRDVTGVTPLMVAAMLKRVEILQLLLAARCDVNNTDADGNTALHLAVDEGHAQIVAHLISSGRCIVDATNDRGETALMRAAFYDYSDVIKILLKDGGANADIGNKSGLTALLIALQEGSHVAADILIKHGCDVTHIDDLGRSAMFMAIHSPCIKSLDVAKSLIDAGYDIRQDKIWMLNEEKPNLFYQDDRFYSNLRNKLHQNSVDSNNNDTTCRQGDVKTLRQRDKMDTSSPYGSPSQSSGMTSPFLMSPTLKEKIMSSDSGKVTLIPFSKLPASGESVRLGSPTASPLHVRRSLHQAAMSPSWSRPLTPLSCSPPMSPMTPSHTSVRTPDTLFSSPWQPSNPVLSHPHESPNSDVTSRRQHLVKSASEGSDAVPVSPAIKYRRQTSVQSQPNIEQIDPARRLSLPAKHAVKFSTRIQVFEINRT